MLRIGRVALSPTLLLHLAHQASQVRRQCPCQAVYVPQPDVAQATLDVTDVRAMDADLLG